MEITLNREEHPPKTGLRCTIVELPTELEIEQDRNGNIIYINGRAKWSMPWFYSIEETYASELFVENRKWDRRRIL